MTVWHGKAEQLDAKDSSLRAHVFLQARMRNRQEYERAEVVRRGVNVAGGYNDKLRVLVYHRTVSLHISAWFPICIHIKQRENC